VSFRSLSNVPVSRLAATLSTCLWVLAVSHASEVTTPGSLQRQSAGLASVCHTRPAGLPHPWSATSCRKAAPLTFLLIH